MGHSSTPPPRPRSPGRTPLTDPDRELLQFLAEHRVAVAPQVEALLSVSPLAAERRLRSLDGHGYVRRESIFAHAPAASWITPSGLAAIGSRLPAPRPDLKGYRHDVGVAWLWLAARAGAFGAIATVHSEREMRSHDRRDGRERPAFGVGLGTVGPRGGERLHYPDLLLDTVAGHRIALELELTPKSARRMDQIMLGYAVDARINVVQYLVPDRPLLEKVRSAARRARIGSMVHVQRLAGGSVPGAPAPIRSRVRHTATSTPDRSDGRVG